MCMCICTFVITCSYVITFTCIHICVYVYMHMHTHVWTKIYTCIVCAHTQCMCIFNTVSVYVYAHVYIWQCVYTYMNACMRVLLLACRWLPEYHHRLLHRRSTSSPQKTEKRTDCNFHQPLNPAQTPRKSGSRQMSHDCDEYAQSSEY